MSNGFAFTIGKVAGWLAHAVPVLVRDLVGIVGAASISYGAWLAYQPAGFVVGGALLLTASILGSRGSP